MERAEALGSLATGEKSNGLEEVEKYGSERQEEKVAESTDWQPGGRWRENGQKETTKEFFNHPLRCLPTCTTTFYYCGKRGLANETGEFGKHD